MMISCLVSKITLFDCVRNMKIHYCILGGLFYIMWQNLAVVKLMKIKLSQCGFIGSLFDYSSFAIFSIKGCFSMRRPFLHCLLLNPQAQKRFLWRRPQDFHVLLLALWFFLWGKGS